MKRSLAPRDAYGVNALIHLSESLLWDVSDVACYLSVTPRTVRRWLDCTVNVPRSAVIALWFESHYGHAAIAAETMNQCAALRGVAKGLEREKAALLERLSLLSHDTHGAANQCVYSIRDTAPTTKRPTAFTHGAGSVPIKLNTQNHRNHLNQS